MCVCVSVYLLLVVISSLQNDENVIAEWQILFENQDEERRSEKKNANAIFRVIENAKC